MKHSCRQCRKTQEDIIGVNCSKPYDDVCKDTDRDYWLKADAAKEYGIVDSVLMHLE